MKKMLRILTVAVFSVFLVTVAAWATPLNPLLSRPVTINPAYPGENSLQQELNAIFSVPVDAATDQLDVGMFKIASPGSDLISPQLKFEWTSNAPAQTIGIFGWDSLSSSAITAQIFAGSQIKGDYANIKWLTPDSGKIATFAFDTTQLSSIDFSGISRDFFGFYFSPNGTQKYYTVDSLNPGGEVRVLGYLPSTAAGAVFSYEDGNDFDYQDAGFFVESINTVPEPMTLLLLGLGLVGVAGIRRKFKG